MRASGSGFLSIPSDELTVGDKMKEEMAKTKFIKNLKNKEFETKKVFEREKFIRKFSSRLTSNRFQSRMQRNVKNDERNVEVLRMRSKYLSTDDADLLRALKDYADQHGLQVKVYDIHRYKMEYMSMLIWYAHPHKRPVIFKCNADKDPNDGNYELYQMSKDKQGKIKTYGVAVFVTV